MKNTDFVPVPPSGPYKPSSAQGEALVLAQQSDFSEARLQKLAKDKNVNPDHLKKGLKLGARDTETKIGKNGFLWDLDTSNGHYRVSNLRRTSPAEMQKREKYGMVRGSQKLRDARKKP